MDIEDVIKKIEKIIKDYKSGSLSAEEVIPDILNTFKAKRGAKKRSDVKERELSIARKILLHKFSIERGESNKNISNFIADLVIDIEHECDRAYSDSDIYKIYNKYRVEVMSELIDINEMIRGINKQD